MATKTEYEEQQAIEKLKQARLRSMAQRELMKRELSRDTDLQRRIKSMSDLELEQIVAGERSQS